ncbi:MAG: carbon-nitrogen hydrolase family protein [Alphaproteobacteria bacterium]|nr:carbon-nitrogen hydrolase family protein [Alphaproteobacteria bacterium]
MSNVFKAACVQMTSGPVIDDNLKAAGEMIREAAAAGARLIATPENTCHMIFPATERLKTSPVQEKHPGLPYFSDLARELGVWLSIGSMSVKAGDGKLFNRSFLFSDDGALVATYDKIHLFDVQLPTGETHKESDLMNPGTRAVAVKTPLAALGLSVCYDLRFSYLFRDLAKARAEVLMVPAAFTVPTGKAHWETLIRARAIETGSFVVAAAQTGEHAGGRKTWGHSMIVGPWGEVLAAAGEETGIIMAEIDTAQVARVRAAIPALKHDREYEIINV